VYGCRGSVSVSQRVAAMRVPTPEQVAAILAACDDRFRVYVAVCAFAGLRRGEASALQAGDVDFLKRRISVARQVQRADGRTVEIRLPKYGSERDVYVPDELL
jgi:integrase